MAEKCDKGNGAACYISASLIKADEPEKSLKFFEKSCEKGIVEACLETGKSLYEKKQYKEAAQHFYEACGMNSKEGCHLAAYVTEKGSGKEENAVLAGIIYKKACNLGYEASCKTTTKYVNNSSQNRQVTKPKNQPGKETYRPYKAAGISLIVVGAVVTIAGVVGFHVASDKEYDKYKKFTEYSTAEDYVDNWSKEGYVSEANKHRNKSNTFRALEVTSGIVGGTLFITGIALTAVKKEKPEDKISLTNISFTPSDDGFYAALGFEF